MSDLSAPTADGAMPKVVVLRPTPVRGEEPEAGFLPPLTAGAVPPAAPSSPPPPSRVVGRGLYLKIRAGHPHFSHTETLDALLALLKHRRDRLPPNSPPADRALLDEFAIQDSWEDAHEATRVTATLAKHALDGSGRLNELRNVERLAKDLLDDALARALPDPNNPLAPPPPAATYEKVRMAQRMWIEAREDLQKEEDSSRRRVLEGEKSATARERIDELTQLLIAQYDGLGPQYELMCRSLAEVRVRREQMAQGGRDITTSEFAEMAKLELNLIAQIQKHTEATKSESLSKEAKEMALAVLRIVERTVSPRNPALWRDVVQEVKVALGSTHAVPQKPTALPRRAG